MNPPSVAPTPTPPAPSGAGSATPPMSSADTETAETLGAWSKRLPEVAPPPPVPATGAASPSPGLGPKKPKKKPPAFKMVPLTPNAGPASPSPHCGSTPGAAAAAGNGKTPDAAVQPTVPGNHSLISNLAADDADDDAEAVARRAKPVIRIVRDRLHVGHYVVDGTGCVSNSSYLLLVPPQMMHNGPLDTLDSPPVAPASPATTQGTSCTAPQPAATTVAQPQQQQQLMQLPAPLGGRPPRPPPAAFSPVVAGGSAVSSIAGSPTTVHGAASSGRSQPPSGPEGHVMSPPGPSPSMRPTMPAPQPQHHHQQQGATGTVPRHPSLSPQQGGTRVKHRGVGPSPQHQPTVPHSHSGLARQGGSTPGMHSTLAHALQHGGASNAGSPVVRSTPPLRSTNRGLPVSPIVYANLDFPVDDDVAPPANAAVAPTSGTSNGGGQPAPAPANDSVASRGSGGGGAANDSMVGASPGSGPHQHAHTFTPPTSTETGPATAVHASMTPLSHYEPGSNTCAHPPSHRDDTGGSHGGDQPSSLTTGGGCWPHMSSSSGKDGHPPVPSAAAINASFTGTLLSSLTASAGPASAADASPIAGATQSVASRSTGASSRRLRLQYDDLDLLERLSGGATGEVYRAQHAPTGKMLAVKVIDLRPVAEADRARRVAEGSSYHCSVNSVPASPAGSAKTPNTPAVEDGTTGAGAPPLSSTESAESPSPTAEDEALLRNLSMHGSFGQVEERRGSERVEQLQAAVVRELRVLHSHYRCPHVLKIYDAFYHGADAKLRIVMEYMRFGSLEHLARQLDPTGGERRVAIPERILAVVAEQVLLGLVDMHSRGHIHRDIKPTNVLIGASGAVKLADFGLCEELELGAEDTKDTEHCSGTNHYMSPERLRGEPHGPASDVWAVGLTLAECACGRYPVNLSGCRDSFEVMDRMSRPIVFPATVADKLTDRFKSFIRRAMHPDPRQRPSAAQLLEDPFLSQWCGAFDFTEYINRCVAASQKARAEAKARRKVADRLSAQQDREWNDTFAAENGDDAGDDFGSGGDGNTTTDGSPTSSTTKTSPADHRHGFPSYVDPAAIGHSGGGKPWKGFSPTDAIRAVEKGSVGRRAAGHMVHHSRRSRSSSIGSSAAAASPRRTSRPQSALGGTMAPGDVPPPSHGGSLASSANVSGRTSPHPRGGVLPHPLLVSDREALAATQRTLEAVERARQEQAEREREAFRSTVEASTPNSSSPSSRAAPKKVQTQARNEGRREKYKRRTL